MEKKYYFIGGLPRSGSTLLAGILNQNTQCHASMSSSLFYLFKDIQFQKQPDIITLNQSQAKELYISSVRSFYTNVNKQIIFDTNRNWPRFVGIIPKLFPYTKFIFCVRDIPSILNSFENHYLNNFLAPSYVSLAGSNNPWVRFDEWFNTLVAGPYDNCDYIYHSPELKKHCIFIDYDDLVNKTSETIANLYNELELPSFNHDFNNIEHSFDYVDDKVNNHNLHKVYPKVGKTPTKWILPPGVVEKYSRKCFWKDE